MNKRYKGNGIVAIYRDIILITQVEYIKLEVHSNFKTSFRSLSFTDQGWMGVMFKQYSNANSFSLEGPLSLEDIKEVVWFCDGEKILGPNGFNMRYFKKCWDVIKGICLLV